MKEYTTLKDHDMKKGGRQKSKLAMKLEGGSSVLSEQQRKLYEMLLDILLNGKWYQFMYSMNYV